MKKYKKKSNKKGKLLQIRLSEEEYKMVVGFINKFSVTHREWILTSVNELWNYNIIRGGSFWYSDSDYESYLESKKKQKKETLEEIMKDLPDIMRGKDFPTRHGILSIGKLISKKK